MFGFPSFKLKWNKKEDMIMLSESDGVVYRYKHNIRSHVSYWYIFIMSFIRC